MSINKAKSIKDVISKLTYITKKLDENESAEDFAISMMIGDCLDYLRDIENPWHTGTPTEDGLYAVCLEEKPFFPYSFAIVEEGDLIMMGGSSLFENPKILAYQKEEPYKAQGDKNE